MLICNSVLVYQSSVFGGFVQIVLKSKLIALVASKKSSRHLFPIYIVGKIVSAKVRLQFILNQNLVRPAYRLTSVQVVSFFKQINETPVRSRFYAQCRPGLKILFGSFLRSFRSSFTKFRSRACCIKQPITLRYDRFFANAAFSFALFFLNAKIPISYQR